MVADFMYESIAGVAIDENVFAAACLALSPTSVPTGAFLIVSAKTSIALSNACSKAESNTVEIKGILKSFNVFLA